MKKNQIRNVEMGDILRGKIDSGVKVIKTVALASYGINSGNVLIPHIYGEPLISHDGITNIGRLVSQDDTENSTISVIRQAAEKTNRIAGDATSLTTVMACEVYEYYKKFLDISPRELEQRMRNDKNIIIEYLKSISKPATKKDIFSVSMTASNDNAIATLVSNSVNSVGKNGGISIIETPDPYISTEIFSGALLNTGMKSPAFATEMTTVSTAYNESYVVILENIYQTSAEILPLLQNVMDYITDNKKQPVIIIGDISGQALEVILQNKNRGMFDITVIEPESSIKHTMLNDLAIYVGGKVFNGKASEYDCEKFIGEVKSAKITLGETVLEGKTLRDESKIKERIKEIEKHLEENLTKSERDIFEKRHAILSGKAIKIRVGANSQAERQELKLRVEDAVCASQAAQKYGVLPGGGISLRNCWYENKNLSYLAKPYEYLTGRNAEDFYRNINCGIDMRTGNVEDIVKAGILDSYLAISEAINNSFSVAESLLTVKLALPFRYREWECSNE